MTGMPRGSMRRPSAPSPLGLWLARTVLFGVFVLAVSQMAAWIVYYMRF